MVPLMMLLESCDTDACANGIKWSKMLCCTSFWLSWHKECNGVIVNTIGLIPLGVPMVYHVQGGHCAPHFNNCDLRNAMAPLMMLFTSHDADINAVASNDTSINGSSITWWKSHVTPHSSCLELRNAVVPLMMLLAACYTDASASGIKWPESHVLSHFNCLDLRNAVVPFLLPLALCAARPVSMASNGPKNHVASSFNHL